MAQLAFGVAAAGAASFAGAGPLGTQLAFAGGSLIGSALFPPDDIVHSSPMPNRQPITTSAFGLARPVKFGTIPVVGNIIDASEDYIEKQVSRQEAGGKGLGGGQEVITETYTVSRDIAIGLGEPIAGVLQVYANTTLLYDSREGSTVIGPEWLNMRVYLGTEDQEIDPTLQALHGDLTPAYRGEAYIVFTRFQLADYNNQVPTFRVVVVTNANPVVSEEIKSFADTGKVGGLAHDYYSSLIYYVSSGRDGDQIGWIYDPATEDTVNRLEWPAEATRLDEGGGIGLFSIPTVVDGLQVDSGPNAHLYVNVEVGELPAVLIYDGLSGAYRGYDFLNIYTGANTKGVTIDERKGIFLREHLSSNSFFSYISIFEASFDIGGVSISSNGNVEIPIANRDDVNEWNWQLDSSYPEGTTRAGAILVHANDNVSIVDYLCLISGSELRIVSNYVQESDFDQIYRIVWDSVQNYFWVIGESDVTGQTRFKAYDLDLVVQWNESQNNNYYLSHQYITYDPKTFSIWLQDIVTGDLAQWSTVQHEYLSINSGFSTAVVGTGDGLAYINYTRTAWVKKGNADLYLNRLGRITDSGVSLDVPVADYCRRAGLQPSQYNVVKLQPITVSGTKIEQDGPIKTYLTELMTAYLFDAVDKGSFIDFIPRGQALTDTIPETDLGCSVGYESKKERIEINRVMDLELPGRTEVTYYSRNMEWEQNTQLARRQASNVKDNAQKLTFNLSLTDDEAAQLSDILNHLAHIEREQYKITALPGWKYLAPADVIDIEANNRKYTSRIANKSYEDGLVSIYALRENTSVLTSYLEGGNAPGRDISVIINPLTYSIHLDIPMLREADSNAGYYLSACGSDASWTGGNIYKSADGNSFNLTTTVLTPSDVGNTVDLLSDTVNPALWDRVSSIEVYMPCGTLESKTEEQVLQGANTAVIGRHGRWEVVSFANAVLIDVDTYQVDTFVRGRLGTEWATGMHQISDSVCMLSTDDITYIADSLANLNRQFLYRAVSLGGQLYGDRVVDQFHTNTGVCLKPYSVSQYKIEKDVNTLDLTFTWMPRTRVPWANYWSGVASDPDNYEIDIETPTQTVTKVIPNDTQYFYSRTDQLTDGFDEFIPNPSDMEIYQISDSVGRGYKNTQAITVGIFVDPFVEYAITVGANPIWELDETTSAQPATEFFGNYDGGYGGSPALNQPSLLPSDYKTSMQVSGNQWFGSGEMPGNGAAFDDLNHSYSILVQLQQASDHDQILLTGFFFPPTVIDYFRVYLLSTGVIRLWWQSLGGAIKQVDTTYSPVVGITTLFTVTFSASALDTDGEAKIYANNTLIGTISDAQMSTSGYASPRYVLSGYSTSSTAISVNTQHHQLVMIYDHALTQTEINQLAAQGNL